MTPRTAEAGALAYAARLDRTLAAGPDDATHDRLQEASRLCGGLSERGFAADLKQWLEDDEEGVLIGCDLSRRPEDKARWWLAGATARMEGTMTYANKLLFVAGALMPTQPDYACMLENIALGVRRLERALDEMAQEAMEEEQIRRSAPANVVHLDRFRRVPISEGRAG